LSRFPHQLALIVRPLMSATSNDRTSWWRLHLVRWTQNWTLARQAADQKQEIEARQINYSANNLR